MRSSGKRWESRKRLASIEMRNLGGENKEKKQKEKEEGRRQWQGGREDG